MWQRFKERAKRVIYFAQQEAGKLELDVVDTEHLLVGLIRENDNVAARVLDRMGISLSQIRSEIEAQVTKGNKPKAQSMELTQNGKRALDLAADESKRLNNDYIGTEHILLGLISESDGMAGRVLAKLGVELEKTRAEIDHLQDRG